MAVLLVDKKAVTRVGWWAVELAAWSVDSSAGHVAVMMAALRVVALVDQKAAETDGLLADLSAASWVCALDTRRVARMERLLVEMWDVKMSDVAWAALFLHFLWVCW